MTELVNEITAEEIAQAYKAALDSVELLKAGQPEGVSDEDWADTVARNKAHLEIMLAKDFWSDEDLKPLQDAVK